MSQETPLGLPVESASGENAGVTGRAMNYLAAHPLLVVAGALAGLMLVAFSCRVFGVDLIAGNRTPTPAATFVVGASPVIAVSPIEGRPGTRITVDGQGWRPGDTVFMRLQDPATGQAAAADQASAIVTDAGTFTVKFIFPLDLAWVSTPRVLITAVSPSSGQEATVVFRLLGLPEIPPTLTPDEADLADLARRILDCAREIDARNRCDQVWVNVWDHDPAIRALAGSYATPDREKSLVGSLSVWLDSLDDRAWIEEMLRSPGVPVYGYLVTESIVREYQARDWLVGERSPGITLVAAFRKSAVLADEKSDRRWHEGHSKLSLKVHPLWRYVRNTVARVITPGAPDFRAIVEERVRRYEDMEPEAFYRGQQPLVANDLATFVDLGGIDQMRIELMSEYILRQRSRDSGTIVSK